RIFVVRPLGCEYRVQQHLRPLRSAALRHDAEAGVRAISAGVRQLLLAHPLSHAQRTSVLTCPVCPFRDVLYLRCCHCLTQQRGAARWTCRVARNLSLRCLSLESPCSPRSRVRSATRWVATVGLSSSPVRRGAESRDWRPRPGHARRRWAFATW